MEQKRAVKEFCRKIMDKFKGGEKKNFYWPEFDAYCGCCSLKSGIYIRSIITLTVSVIFLVVHGLLLDFLFEVSRTVNGSNMTAIEEILSVTRDPERDLATMQFMCRTLITFFIMWIIFKLIYMIIVIWTAYAIFKNKPRMLKCLLFVSICNCFLDFFLSFIALSLLNSKVKRLLILCNLSEAYNILAVNSQYKKMKGKNRIAEDFELSYEPRSESRNINRPHCGSCSCFTENNSENIPIRSETNNIESDTSTVNNDLIDQGTNDSNTVMQSEMISSNNVDNSEEVSDGEELGAQEEENNEDNDLNKAKIDIDINIIYDEQQLNVGTSPVIEDRHFLDGINYNSSSTI